MSPPILLPLFVLSTFVSLGLCSRQPSFDHQNVTYFGNHGHLEYPFPSITVTPFFSPDHSLSVWTQLIDSAQFSIGIKVPSFEGWLTCTNSNSSAVGCEVPFVRNDTFPIFRSLLNAIHRNVTVRILTNYYEEPCSPNLIVPLDFLCLAGASCRMFRTVTFLHQKFMMIDGKVVLISSDNFSKTSFTMNREAGVVLSGGGVIPFSKFTLAYFNLDWNLGTAYPVNTYNSSMMRVINDPALVPVVFPPPVNYTGAYVTNVTSFDGPHEFAGIIASPDDAYMVVTSYMKAANVSIAIEIYQVTNDSFCDFLLNLYQQGKVRITLLVSNRIYSVGDELSAEACYKRLYSAGMKIRKTSPSIYSYYHQKFWIIDDSIVFVSSGNMGTTDFPPNAIQFPVFGQQGWQHVNRDNTFYVKNPAIAAHFQNVLNQDYTRGVDYVPKTTVPTPMPIVITTSIAPQKIKIQP